MLSVVRIGEATCLWTFSDEIIAVTDASGLHTLLGGMAVGSTPSGVFALEVTYDLDTPAGSAWDVILASVAITFASGLPLQGGSGVIG